MIFSFIFEFFYWHFINLLIHDNRIGKAHSIYSFISGFGFSDKPQPRYGFDYTLDGNCFSGPNNLLFIGNSCFDK